MMKYVFLFLCFISCSAFAKVLPGPALKTISPDFFQPGQRWYWKYYQDGVLYSTERYTVLAATPQRVFFEMATKLSAESTFRAHHRIEVNPQKCLRAYQNPAQHIPYSFQLYYLQNGQWQLVDGLTSPLAFEEKFNCNPYRLKGTYKSTFFQSTETDLGIQELFQQRKGPLDMSSWYFNTTDYPGIMAYKRMSRPQERVQYHIRFSLSE